MREEPGSRQARWRSSRNTGGPTLRVGLPFGARLSGADAERPHYRHDAQSQARLERAEHAGQ